MVNHIVTPHPMPANHRHKLRSVPTSPVLIALMCGACMALTACGSVGTTSTVGSVNPVNWVTPFKTDVIQGNFVSKEQTDALAVGMSRSQTKDVLGTPLLASLFHEARWDYVFTFKRQGAAPQAYKYTVFFEGDRLIRFEGDVMPSEAEFLSTLNNKRKVGAVPVLEATEAQLNAAQKPSLTTTAATAVAPTAPQTVTYPPLESPKP